MEAMSDRDELREVETKINAARAKLDAAELVYREAQEAYAAETKPLFALREHLLCNAGEWQGGAVDV
jgi:hypothetical protein